MISRPVWSRVMSSLPPPAGSRNACAQPYAGLGSGVSGRPLSEACQLALAGSASTSVPPAAGAAAPLTLTVPDARSTWAPPGSTTRTRPAGTLTRHSAKEEVWLTGRSPTTPSSSRASPGSTGAGSRT